MWEKFDWTAKLGLTRGKVRSGRRDELTQAFRRLVGPIRHTYLIDSFSLISSRAVIVIQLEHSSHHAFIDPGISPKCNALCRMSGLPAILDLCSLISNQERKSSTSRKMSTLLTTSPRLLGFHK